MGTNYYIKKDYCDKCGRSNQEHIGKASEGWKFLFKLPQGMIIESIDDMKAYITGKVISNEYGEEVSHSDFWEMVEEKQKSQENENRIINLRGYNFLDSEFS